ncbi:MAG: hypothetical protein HY293_16515 [Planctomycetes bacterium]|nr:hypothetical protein [Planctomycetota bacterium]
MSAADLPSAIERLYGVFSAYARPEKVTFCGFCYTPEQIHHLQVAPLREIDPQITRRLIWEVSDHFDNTQAYKHYLPRILEHLAPPIRCEDLFPEHLFETMKAQGFADWLPTERAAFWDYAVAVAESLKEIDGTAAREWETASMKLPGCPFPPP